MALAFYRKDIKERALAIAKLIREIPDETERRQTAREVCLQAVKDDPTFPEVRFLRDCGIKLNLSLGPALKVKKSKHFIRTCAADEKFESFRHCPIRRRQQREHNGEHDYPIFLDEVVFRKRTGPWTSETAKPFKVLSEANVGSIERQMW